MDRSFAWPLAYLLIAAGCRQTEPVLSRPLDDRAIVAVDGLAPANTLEGQGSLGLGEGWGMPESGGETDDWRNVAWVLGREAVVYLPKPPVRELDFVGRCLPFPWQPDSPQQIMEVLVNDRSVGQVEMVKDWQDLRIPLPDDLPRRGLVTLKLRFAHALKPRDLGMGQDPRSLAAAFSWLAVVPRGVEDPSWFVRAQSLDSASGRISLPAGGGASVLLPAASTVGIRLGEILSQCEDCQVEISLTGPDGPPTSLWNGAAARNKDLELEFETGPQGLHRLWVRISAKPGQTSDALVSFVLDRPILKDRRALRRAAAAQKPNVFVYMIDTLRADVLAAGGGDPALTPRMNEFATEAATYLDARAPSSWTLPSVTSLLTGTYPDRHGVMSGFMQYDPERLPGLQHLLASVGYRTLGISQSFIASGAYNLDKGFHHFMLRNQLNGWKLQSQEARELFGSWLGTHPDPLPLFAYLHTVDPHAPYSPPDPFRKISSRYPGTLSPEEYVPDVFMAKGHISRPEEVAHMRALYLDEVHYTDREFGRFLDLLKWLDLYRHSFVVLVSDHGEEFGEHSGFDHGETLFDEVLKVPMIIKYPSGRWAGERVNQTVSLVDVVPTLAAAIGFKNGERTFDGEVLPPARETRRRERPLYFEVQLAREVGQVQVDLRGMVVGKTKCLENRTGVDRYGRPTPTWQAFDLSVDPGETRPLGASTPAVARCKKWLLAWSAARELDAEQGRSRREATPQTLDRLRSLGYLN